MVACCRQSRASSLGVDRRKATCFATRRPVCNGVPRFANQDFCLQKKQANDDTKTKQLTKLHTITASQATLSYTYVYGDEDEY